MTYTIQVSDLIVRSDQVKAGLLVPAVTYQQSGSFEERTSFQRLSPHLENV